MKNKEGITWMHVEKVQVLEEILDLPQSCKWMKAMFTAPSWKKDEYGAQFIAWLEDELEPWHDWCNPLARA